MSSGQKQHEVELISLARQGNESAFAELFLLHRLKVQQVVLLHIHRRSEAEDVAQDVFIKAFSRLDQFQGKSSFFTWLYRIASNTAKNAIQHQKIRVPLQDVDMDDAVKHSAGQPFMRHISSPEKMCAKEELKQKIAHQLDQLPSELVEVVYLREINGHSYEEIAEMTECPIGTVRSRLHRARSLLGHL